MNEEEQDIIELQYHMTDLEFALSKLGEAILMTLIRVRGSDTLNKRLRDAHDAGALCGQFRLQIEALTGEPVVSSENAFDRRRKSGILDDHTN